MKGLNLIEALTQFLEAKQGSILHCKICVGTNFKLNNKIPFGCNAEMGLMCLDCHNVTYYSCKGFIFGHQREFFTDKECPVCHYEGVKRNATFISGQGTHCYCPKCYFRWRASNLKSICEEIRKGST
jgi:hypothetical protein